MQKAYMYVKHEQISLEMISLHIHIVWKTTQGFFFHRDDQVRIDGVL